MASQGRLSLELPLKNTDLENGLTSWARWLRLRRAVYWSSWGLGVGAAAGLTFGLAAIAQARLLEAEFVWLVPSAGLLGALVAGVIGYFFPLSLGSAAIFIDRMLNLKERLSTAWEIEQGKGLSSSSLDAMQRQDALLAMEGIQIRKRLRLKASRRALVLGGLLVLSVLPATWLATESFTEAENKRRVQTALEAQAEEIETLIEQAGVLEDLPLQSREEALLTLVETVDQLRTAQSLEAGLAALDAAAESLEALQDPTAGPTIERLRSAAQAAAADLPEALAENLAQGHVPQAADQLESLDPAGLTEEQRAALAAALSDWSAAIENNAPDLASALSTAGETLASGDPASSRQALQTASESLRDLAVTAAQSDTLGGISNALEEAQGQLAASGQNQASASTTAELAGSGADPGGTEADSQGSSSGMAGSGRGDPTGAALSGGTAGDEPIGQANDPGDLGLANFSELFSPINAGLESIPGEVIQLPSSDGEPGNQVTGQFETSPPTPGSSRVPYVEVYPEYQDLWRQVVDNGTIPPHLVSLVQDYFAGLEP